MYTSKICSEDTLGTDGRVDTPTRVVSAESIPFFAVALNSNYGMAMTEYHPIVSRLSLLHHIASDHERVHP
jgi:hypothetical protein